MRYLISAPLMAVGTLLALYGVFALIYGADGSGTTYVKIAGHEMNARLAGGLSLALAAVLFGVALVVAQRPSMNGSDTQG